MKKLLLLPFTVLGLLLLPTIASAQAQWVQDTSFNDALETDGVNVRSNHGLTVDPDGNVWVQQYYADSFIDEIKVRGIYIYGPDNQQTAISPIKVFEWEDGSRVDTFYNTGLGMSADYDGNILVSTFNSIYKLDYKTGKVMAYVNVASQHDFGTISQSLTRAVADEEGNVYVRAVFPGIPMFKFDKNLENMEIVIDEPESFSRSFQVSKDGNSIYNAGYPTGSIQVYSRPDEFSSYGDADTVLVGIKAEAFTIQQSTGRLWVGAGSSNDLPDIDGKGYLPERFYAFEIADLGTENEVPVDSVVYNNTLNRAEGALFGTCRPRAVDFTADGKTAYIGMFECADEKNAVQKFDFDEAGGNAIESLDVVKGYALDQNYPNPFNPTTNISFTLKDAGMVSVKVYDMTGRVVATLANSRYTAGSHQVTFNASNLASGVYLYTLEANGVRLTNRMTLIK